LPALEIPDQAIMHDLILPRMIVFWLVIGAGPGKRFAASYAETRSGALDKLQSGRQVSPRPFGPSIPAV